MTKRQRKKLETIIAKLESLQQEVEGAKALALMQAAKRALITAEFMKD